MELLKKMKRKEHQEMILINAPDSFSGYLSEMREVLSIREGLGEDHADFLLVFFTSIDEIEKLAPGILENVTEDPLVWAAYPKKSSRNLKSDITRDKGWTVFGEYGFEPASQISIDDDWSALRFRPVKNIRNFKRNEKMILSEEGRSRSEKESGENR